MFAHSCVMGRYVSVQQHPACCRYHGPAASLKSGPICPPCSDAAAMVRTPRRVVRERRKAGSSGARGGRGVEMEVPAEGCVCAAPGVVVAMPCPARHRQVQRGSRGSRSCSVPARRSAEAAKAAPRPCAAVQEVEVARARKKRGGGEGAVRKCRNAAGR